MGSTEADTTSGHLEDFEWLADLHKSQCFTTSDTSKVATSSDFGCNGFTASLTDWHELLQITAPDDSCGLVFVRGRFPNAPGAILARAQKPIYRGSKDLFGTRLARAKGVSDLELGEKTAQGWINFRWPYTHYELKQKGESSELSGTYEQISFVRNGTVFQIIRIKWGSSGSSLSDYGPTDIPDKQTIEIQTGGRIRFGCPCSNGRRVAVDSYNLGLVNHDETRLECVSEKYQKRLEMQLMVNGEAQTFHPPQGVQESVETIDASYVHRVDLSVGEPTYIVSTLALRGLDDRNNTASIEQFDNLQDYLGINSASVNMGDRLWTALCSNNYEAGEAVEFCAVGRCVEQVIGVATVPFRHKSDSRSNEDIPESIALIQNIMAPQLVDVQSAFYQIRLLTKAYDFISTRHFEPDLLEPIQPLENIRTSYLETLRRILLPALVWLVNTDFRRSRLLPAISSDRQIEQSYPPSSERLVECENDRVEMSFDQTYNRGCYATLAVWYVMKHCPEAVTDDFKSRILLPKLHAAYHSVQERALRDKEPTPKNDILQWYHMSCLFLICCQSFGVGEQGNPIDAFALTDLRRQDVLDTQQRFQKYASRLKTSRDNFYSSKHEELDRVVLLGEELGLEGIPDDQDTFIQASTKARQTRRRIIERKRTTRFNPGPSHWKNLQYISFGPWELTCTNHEIYLQIAEEKSISSARDRVFSFLTSDYSFMACWDGADSEWIAKWWDMEPASIICTTLLHLKEEGKLSSAMSKSTFKEMKSHSAADPKARPDRQPNDNVPAEESSLEKLTPDTLILIRQLLTQDAMRSNDSVRPFEWLRRKPEKLHHPDWWTNSLDDTPEVYQMKQKRDVPLRKDLVKYLTHRKRLDIINNSVYTASNIEAKISAIDLQSLFCFDLRFTNRFGFQLELASESKRLQEPSTRNLAQLQAQRAQFFKKLNDSLVDLDIKHRILFAKRCTPALVGSVIYLWHPDALNTLDSYFGAVSRFADNNEGISWTTSITLSHWILSPTQYFDENADLFQENRSNGFFPPMNINSSGPQGGHLLEERSSSLVITGDLTGHLWICSMLTCLTGPKSVYSLVNDSVRRILHRFIHQQATGRCLVFLVLLGHMCETLASEYETILTQLDTIVGLGEEVLLQGIDWGTSQALEKLKKMLWGLEALRAFDERLSANLAQINRAKEAMERFGKKDAAYMHVDLLQEYQQVVEEFTKRYDTLSDVDMRTKLKIKQVTGLRDGISTVTNVEDSQTQVRQGINIKTLTYITIAYLPLGFVTGLFSISHAPFMDQAGDVHFGVLTAVLVVVTYSTALFLQNIIDQWSHFIENWETRKSGHLPTRASGESTVTSRRRKRFWIPLVTGNKDDDSSGSP